MKQGEEKVKCCFDHSVVKLTKLFCFIRCLAFQHQWRTWFCGMSKPRLIGGQTQLTTTGNVSVVEPQLIKLFVRKILDVWQDSISKLNRKDSITTWRCAFSLRKIWYFWILWECISNNTFLKQIFTFWVHRIVLESQSINWWKTDYTPMHISAHPMNSVSSFGHCRCLTNFSSNEILGVVMSLSGIPYM